MLFFKKKIISFLCLFVFFRLLKCVRFPINLRNMYFGIPHWLKEDGGRWCNLYVITVLRESTRHGNECSSFYALYLATFHSRWAAINRDVDECWVTRIPTVLLASLFPPGNTCFISPPSPAFSSINEIPKLRSSFRELWLFDKEDYGFGQVSCRRRSSKGH